jgi:hypothetical protein
MINDLRCRTASVGAPVPRAPPTVLHAYLHLDWPGALGAAPSVRLHASCERAERAERNDSSMWCAVDVGTLIA